MTRLYLKLRIPAMVSAWIIIVQATWSVDRIRNPLLIFGAVMVIWLVIEQINKRKKEA